MRDLVKELRGLCDWLARGDGFRLIFERDDVLREAADRIEELEKGIAVVRCGNAFYASAARREALEEAARAYEAEAETWVAWPQAGAAKRKGAAAIRKLMEQKDE